MFNNKLTWKFKWRFKDLMNALLSSAFFRGDLNAATCPFFWRGVDRRQEVAKLKDPVSKEQRTDAIYSIPCNDCDNESIGQTKSQFGHVWKIIKKRSSFAKKKIQLYRSTHDWPTIQLGGINPKLSPLIGVTNGAFVWKPAISTPPTLLWIVMMAVYFLTPVYTSSEKRVAI